MAFNKQPGMAPNSTPPSAVADPLRQPHLANAMRYGKMFMQMSPAGSRAAAPQAPGQPDMLQPPTPMQNTRAF